MYKFLKKFTRTCYLVASAFIILNSAVATYAEPREYLDLFAANDIIFYDPDGCENNNKCEEKAVSGSDLTVIGDSILADSVTKQKMMDKFSGLTDANYDAVVGRPWATGLSVAKSMTLKNTVIFEQGSNNTGPTVTDNDIDSLIEITGKERTVILVTNYGTASQYIDPYNKNNETFKRAAEKYDNIVVADWYTAAKNANANMDSMTVHPNDDAARDLYVETIAGVTGSGSCGGGRAVIKGDKDEEKIWSGLTSLGFTEEQTAGIMGNMMHESNSFNPAQHEGSQYNKYWPGMSLGTDSEKAYGLGLIQWSFSRRVNMYNYVKEKAPDLIDHFENPDTYSKKNGSIYGCNGDCYISLAGESDANRMYSLQLTFLYDELQGESSYSGIFNQSSVYDAAKFFLEHVEIPQNPYISSHPERATDAESFYQKFKGSEFTLSSTSTGSSSSGTSLGSSPSSGTSSGTSSSAGLSGAATYENYDGERVLDDDQIKAIEENQPLYEKIVEGTDYPWQIMATIHYLEYGLGRNITKGDPLCNGGGCSNGLFQTIYNQYPIMGYVDDDNFVKMGKDAVTELQQSNSDLDLTKDGDIKKLFFRYNGTAGVYKQQARDLGFSEEEAENGEGSPYVMNRYDRERDPKYNKTTWGQIKRDYGPIEYPANMHFGAYVIYTAIGGGSGGSSKGRCGKTYGGGNMDVNQTAIDLAWPIGDPHNSANGGAVNGETMALTASDEYDHALQEVGLKTYGDAQVQRGSSCDAFVTTVYRYSGVDKDFYCCGCGYQIDYLTGAGAAKFDEIEYTKSGSTGDTSVLKPGDVMICSGHILLYIELDGKGMEAQASYGDHSGQISEGVGLYSNYHSTWYRVFRFKS